jgi:hypothetical protein
VRREEVLTGHDNVAITSTYLHVVVDAEEEIGNRFSFQGPAEK